MLEPKKSAYKCSTSFTNAMPETDVSFSTQGGPCRLRYDDTVVDLKDLSRQRRNVKHIRNTRVIYWFRSTDIGDFLLCEQVWKLLR